jgi:probable F420-dependent oxidoreductase
MTTSAIELGLFGINMGPCARPEGLRAVARAAEDAGFESLWTGEHVVLPDPQKPPSPLPPDYPMLDPAVALAYAAACTKRVRLGTGIIILPQRNPLVLAKELASVDVLSSGRLIFGIGIGYLEAEFDALGISFEHKAARTVEYLEAIRSVWHDAKPAYRGSFVSFDGIQARPRPDQQPCPPIVIGGMSDAALRRAVRHGHGWYGFNQNVEQTADCLARLERIASQCERRGELGRLEISVTPPPGNELPPALVRRYADLGVDRLVPFCPALEVDDVRAFVGRVGEEVVASL